MKQALTCGVHITGTVSSGGFSVPLDLDCCINGIAAASCSASNMSLRQGVASASAGGVTGAVNLTYIHTPSCKAGVITLNLN